MAVAKGLREKVCLSWVELLSVQQGGIVSYKYTKQYYGHLCWSFSQLPTSPGKNLPGSKKYGNILILCNLLSLAVDLLRGYRFIFCGG